MSETVKKPKKINNGIKLLGLVILLYLIISIFNLETTKEAFINFAIMFAKIIPILFFTLLIMILINLFFTVKLIEKYLGQSSGIRGWLYATMAGIIVSGPPYILYPLLGDFKNKGMSNNLLAVFLYNRNVKITFMPVMAYYFGIKYTIIISLYIIIFSIFNGKIIDVFVKEETNKNKIQ